MPPRPRAADAPARRGRPPRTEAQRAEQRARLIEASMEAVRRHGADVSIDEMAAVAGVSKPVLYDEFGGKLGVADAVALVLAGRVEEQVLADLAASETLDLAGAVVAVVNALVNLIDDEPDLYAFMVRSIRTSDRGFLDNALVRVVQERATLLIGLVAPGIDADRLRVLTDGAFGFVFAAVESWIANRALPKAELVQTLATVMREGLRASAAGLE